MFGAYVIIVVGLILLGINFGYLDSSIWSTLWRFWPALLILGGVSMLTKKAMPKGRRLAVGLALIAVLVALGYLAYNNGFIPEKLTRGDTSSQTLSVDEPLSSAIKEVDLIVELGAQNIKLDDTSSGLIVGRVGSFAGEPEIGVKEVGEKAEVRVKTKFGPAGWWPGKQKTGDTKLSITNQIPVNITYKLGATVLDADLRNLNVPFLEMGVGAFDGAIKYGTKQNINQTKINAGASNLKIYVPKTSGLRVDYANGLVGMKFEGLETDSINDSLKETKNYGTAEKKINIEIKAGASSIEFVGY